MHQQHEDRVSRSLRRDFEFLVGINKFLMFFFLTMLLVVGVGGGMLLATSRLFVSFLDERLFAVLFWAGIVGVIVYAAWTTRRKKLNPGPRPD
jgi:hypothetical protein